MKYTVYSVNSQYQYEDDCEVCYASVQLQVAAKFLMRKLRQYPQTWHPAEMNTFPFSSNGDVFGFLFCC